MATIISSKTSGVGGLTVTGDASGVLQLASANGTTAVTIDASQNVGIGVTPSALVSTGGGSGNIAISGNLYTTTGINLCSNFQYLSGYKFYGTGYAGQNYFDASTGGMYWRTSTVSGTAGNTVSWSNPAMTLDASGNLLVGTTSQFGNGVICVNTYKNGSAVAGFITQPSTNANYDAATFKNSSATTVGYIGCTATTTSYVTSSDYRLKEADVPMIGATERVKALRPINFAWKIDGSRVDGFFAHELAEVVPEAATGTKDAIDAEGKPVYQGIDQSKLVPLLTAAIQEQQTLIEALTARLTALEGVSQ